MRSSCKDTQEIQWRSNGMVRCNKAWPLWRTSFSLFISHTATARGSGLLEQAKLDNFSRMEQCNSADHSQSKTRRSGREGKRKKLIQNQIPGHTYFGYLYRDADWQFISPFHPSLTGAPGYALRVHRIIEEFVLQDHFLTGNPGTRSYPTISSGAEGNYGNVSSKEWLWLHLHSNCPHFTTSFERYAEAIVLPAAGPYLGTSTFR